MIKILLVPFKIMSYIILTPIALIALALISRSERKRGNHIFEEYSRY